MNKDAVEVTEVNDTVASKERGNKQLTSKKKFSVRELTVIGMLGAITMLLGITGYGFVPLPLMKATILHIPTIIGALVEGPRVGMIVGLIFGCFSIMQNIMVPSILSIVFLNPLVSVLPRLLVGPLAYLTYRALPGKDVIRVAVSCFLGSVYHTFMVLGMVYVLYAKEFAAIKKIPEGDALNVVLGIAVFNGIPEAVVCAVIATPIILMVKKVLKK